MGDFRINYFPESYIVYFEIYTYNSFFINIVIFSYFSYQSISNFYMIWNDIKHFILLLKLKNWLIIK